MAEGKIKKYLFITKGSFPVGNASTNRALSYMRGLKELNCNVTLLVLGPDYRQSKLSNERKTNYKGVEIKYTCPFLFVKKGVFGKMNLIAGVLLGFLKLIFYLIGNNRKIVVTFLFADPFLLTLFVYPLKIFKVRIFHERTEFPFLSNNISNKSIEYYLNRVIPKFDGLYVISRSLVDYFKGISNKPILHLPMTVEFDRFEKKITPSKNRYIAYCGSMYTDKDGVPGLIEVFNIVGKMFPDILLYLIGDNSDKDKFSIINKEIENSLYRNRIHCTGQVERDNMPELLNNAQVLLLNRPDNIQAKGGFPTKLGEYLSTANPVVITDVGEHTKYLQDEISAFIAKPNNLTDFAERLLFCLNNPELASEVGENGYKVAMKHFNYQTQADSLKHFFNTIV